ncbi:DUF4145 domain-containing protein [Kaistia terrae]|uniref:DUF4145 domain-containing protein n=1 Tax=Kaistia terrae TaxID=537017 RepID=A0ABW0PZH1_9HYPH|nr:DUF4145 domain-containing protein [Kaistia terrae]MCX5580282.1 DUF4145 domain-containing protein [Kaistia terrae]
MRRDLWDAGFTALPKWTCPQCESGSLLTMPDFPRWEETEYSKEEQDHQDSEPDWTVERFVALMKCEVATCGEIVVVGGDRQAWMQDDYERNTQSWESILVCGYVRPAPNIIPISHNLPSECSKQLKKGFELYWVDKAAAANRLRIFVERLMDHFKVPTKGKGKKVKVHTLDLSERIDEFDTMKPGHKDALDALRHVGDYGSHQGEADAQALLDCFELLEDALAELIDQKKAMLAAKAQKLIQNKGKDNW